MPYKQTLEEVLKDNINVSLVRLTDKTGFDHSGGALEASELNVLLTTFAEKMRGSVVEEVEDKIEKLPNIEITSLSGNKEVKVEIKAKSTSSIISLLAKIKDK